MSQVTLGRDPERSTMAKSVVHVIDDDDAMRDTLTYESAANFLKALPRDGSSCVITDMRMPGMSGIDLLRELKRIAPAIPVIVMTGHGDVPLAVEAMKLGAA